MNGCQMISLPRLVRVVVVCRCVSRSWAAAPFEATTDSCSGRSYLSGLCSDEIGLVRLLRAGDVECM